MKHQKRDAGSGVSSSKSNISRAMRGRIPKVPNSLAIRNQQPDAGTASHSEKPTTSSTNTPATVTQPKRSSDRHRRSPRITDLKAHLQTPQFCHHRNNLDERVTWRISNPHPSLSQSRFNKSRKFSLKRPLSRHKMETFHHPPREILFYSKWTPQH